MNLDSSNDLEDTDEILTEFQFWLWYCSFYSSIMEAPDKLSKLKKRKINYKALKKKQKILPNPVSLAPIIEFPIEASLEVAKN